VLLIGETPLSRFDAKPANDNGLLLNNTRSKFNSMGFGQHTGEALEINNLPNSNNFDFRALNLTVTAIIHY
jgi:hypothetical protein